MADEFEYQHEKKKLWKYNTLVMRSGLKALSGLFLVGGLAGMVFYFLLGYHFTYSQPALLSLLLGIICWSIFYKLHLDYRELYPSGGL